MNETQYVSEINGYKIKDSEARTDIGDLTNLNTTEKSSVVGAINEVDDKVNDIGNFSGNEVNTSQIWFNGKPIYRKVFKFSNITLTSSYILPNTIISNLEDFTRVSLYCKQLNNNNWQFLSKSHPYNVDWETDYFYKASDGFMIEAGTEAIEHTNYDIYLVVEYTKITD